MVSPKSVRGNLKGLSEDRGVVPRAASEMDEEEAFQFIELFGEFESSDDRATRSKSAIMLTRLIGYGVTRDVREAALEKYQGSAATTDKQPVSQASIDMVMSEDKDVVKQAFSEVWARNHVRSVFGDMIQSAMKKAFSLSGSFRSENGVGELDDSAINPALVESIQELYSETQDFYRKRGKSSVVAFRGTKERYEGRNLVESWATNRAVAKRFSETKGDVGKILRLDMPVENIMFSFESHPKLLDGTKAEKRNSGDISIRKC